MPARRLEAGTDRHRVLEPVSRRLRRLRPPLRRRQRPRLATALPAAAHRGRGRLRLSVPQRPQGPAPVHGLERRAAGHPAHGRRHRRGPCGVLAYESDNLPEDYRGNLLVTSWGDHRIERYRLQPRGASFRAVDGAGGRRRRRLPAGRHRRRAGRLALLQRLGRQVVRPARQGTHLAAAERCDRAAPGVPEARGEPCPSRPPSSRASGQRAGEPGRRRPRGPGQGGRIEPRPKGTRSGLRDPERQGSSETHAWP